MRIFLSDEHERFRSAFRILFEDRGHLIYGTVRSTEALIGAFRRHSAASTEIDVVVVEQPRESRPDDRWFELVRRCTKGAPIVILTRQDDPLVLQELVDLGPDGLVQKVEGVEEAERVMTEAIQTPPGSSSVRSDRVRRLLLSPVPD